MLELEHAFYILPSDGRQDEGTDVGEADLAAVGVAREHQVDEREAGMKDDLFDLIGLVAHEDYGRTRVGRDGEVEIGDSCAGVVGAAHPKDVAAALDGAVAVDEDGGAVGFERADDVVGAYVDVVVAEDAEARRSVEGGENLGGDACGSPGGFERKGPAAYEVSGDEDEIGMSALTSATMRSRKEGSVYSSR